MPASMSEQLTGAEQRCLSCSYCATEPLQSGCCGHRQGKRQAAPARQPLRVRLQPAAPTADAAAAVARRLLTSVTVEFQPSGQVARKLAIDPRTLGKLTGAGLASVVSHLLSFSVFPQRGASGPSSPFWCWPACTAARRQGGRSRHDRHRGLRQRGKCGSPFFTSALPWHLRLSARVEDTRWRKKPRQGRATFAPAFDVQPTS